MGPVIAARGRDSLRTSSSDLPSTASHSIDAAAWLIERGYTIPRDPSSFMSLSVKTHVGDSYRHPFVVFHELAHGYDYHFIGKGRDYGNKESQANYERMMKEGKYEKVKIWDGGVGSHYARTDRMEYWAESTEAYFAVNDIYPFVRAELREHDPQMAQFVERYWGVDPEHVARLEKDLAAYQQEFQKLAAAMRTGAVVAAGPTVERARGQARRAAVQHRDADPVLQQGRLPQGEARPGTAAEDLVRDAQGDGRARRGRVRMRLHHRVAFLGADREHEHLAQPGFRDTGERPRRLSRRDRLWW